MTTGLELVEAISTNESLGQLSDCGAVPAQIGRAVYGKYQNDRDDISIVLMESEEATRNAIANAIALPEKLTRIATAVWHFQTSPGCHHFVVIPWQTQEGTPTWVYSIFMAYVKGYTLKEYIEGKKSAPRLPPAGNGFRTYWTRTELETMLLDLLRHGDSWQRYFGNVDPRKALKIIINKYPFIRLDAAIPAVNTFVL